ncbi:MAG: hypothetical protein GEU73_07425 [Chloroflexi bacterium]|nr:hypothetical protein [Chloroflexota bacterium]
MSLVSLRIGRSAPAVCSELEHRVNFSYVHFPPIHQAGHSMTREKAPPMKEPSLTQSDQPHSRDPSRTIGRNLEPFLLLELVRAPSYGYDLIRRLDEFGFRRASGEPAVVYKVLRSLEEAGAIGSQWATQESGPARRYYEITDAGRAQLHRRVYHLKRYVERAERLLADYVALTGENPTEDTALAIPEPLATTGDSGRGR